MKSCPHCGASLHEEASFCPYCAQTVNSREEVHPPRHMPGRALYNALIVFAAAALLLLLGFWFHQRPRTYDDNGTAEVVYPGKSNSYRLCFAAEDALTESIPLRGLHYEVDYAYRDSTRLYVTDADSGELAREEFLENVVSITAEIACSEAYVSITCTEPQTDSDYYPDAAATIFVDFNIVAPGKYEAELACTVTMKNGDVIRLHQQRTFESISTYTYTAQDAPMDTIEELQALVEEISGIATEWDNVYLYLPPVVYEGGLDIKGRHINLVGSTGADGQRTTFTGPTKVSAQRSSVYEFSSIDFAGIGAGTGIEANARVHLTGCQVSGWEVGFLAVGNSWINADQTVFEDNTVGMYFNAESGNVSDDYYMDNIFRSNGTAIVLERVPNPTPLSFPGSRFQGNGQDIDNRCGQALDLDGAVFQ